MNTKGIIVKPVVTEKTTDLANTRKQYAFEISKHASKQQVKQTLETLYKVKVADVHVVIRKGKTRRTGRRMMTQELSDRKIAYVRLKEGSFDFFPKA